MASVRELHNEAIHLANMATRSLQFDPEAQVATLFRQAFELESQAASLVPNEPSSEPTRSILYQSAASLALQCGEFKIARQLVAQGLTGSPPPKIEHQLIRLFDQIKLEQNLQTNGMSLDKVDLDMAIQGNSVGAGFILSTELTRRIDNIKRLIELNVQRLMQRPVRRGPIPILFNPFQIGVSVPRSSSFAITLKLIVRNEQQLSLFASPPQVIDEILTSMEMINESRTEDLKNLLKINGYYPKVLALIKDIAPDGEKVNAIAFTTQNRAVRLTRQRHSITLEPVVSNQDQTAQERHSIEVRGILNFADDTKSNLSKVGLTDESGKLYFINVTGGIDELVRSNWKQAVSVSGTTADGQTIYPYDIQSIN